MSLAPIFFGKLETKLDCLKAMLHGAIFLATCNAILLLRDVKLPNTSLHYTSLMFSQQSTYRNFFTDFTN